MKIISYYSIYNGERNERKENNKRQRYEKTNDETNDEEDSSKSKWRIRKSGHSTDVHLPLPLCWWCLRLV